MRGAEVKGTISSSVSFFFIRIHRMQPVATLRCSPRGRIFLSPKSVSLPGESFHISGFSLGWLPQRKRVLFVLRAIRHGCHQKCRGTCNRCGFNEGVIFHLSQSKSFFSFDSSLYNAVNFQSRDSGNFKANRASTHSQLWWDLRLIGVLSYTTQVHKCTQTGGLLVAWLEVARIWYQTEFCDASVLAMGKEKREKHLGLNFSAYIFLERPSDSRQQTKWCIAIAWPL